MFSVILSIGIFTLIITSKALADRNDDELVFAHVVYRHGNRTIMTTYENDPYKNSSYWPEGFSALTNVGKRTQYKLGKYLRRRYQKLIGDTYSSNRVYIQSTDTDRTISSALCNAAGLFAPSAKEIWQPSIKWQPVPVHTVPKPDDYVLYYLRPCEKIDKLILKYLHSPEMNAIMKKHSEFIKYVEKNSGSKINGIDDIFQIFDPLYIEDLRGLQLPSWAEKALKSSNDTLEYLTAVSYLAFTHTTEMKKVKVGFLMKEIFERFKNKTLSLLKPDRSLWIYSAHDFTIMMLLDALNVFKIHMPPFAASLHFELYRRERDYYVQLFYRTDNSEIIPPIEIPKCGTKCPLDKLFELYKDVLPTDNETIDSFCLNNSTDNSVI